MLQSKIVQNNTIYLLLILAIAAILRLVFLGTIPNGFFCDEASNGYDSYSILHTMRDQYGEFLPMFARALNDYRPSLYIFLTIPFIKIFGLNEFATRLPAAVIGILTVLVVFYLVKEIFGQKVAFISALLLSISPWHIQFSRIAFEAILLPFLFSLAVLFFVKSFSNINYLILSAVVFALSLHTYQAARVFVPLFLLGLVILYWQHLWKHRKQTLIALALFLLIFIPLFSFWISPEGMARAASSRVQINPITILQYYLSYLNPNFLFIEGDPIVRHSPAKIGQLYYFEFFTVILGIFYLFKEQRKEKSILLLWLFLYPIPAALTSPEHALRAMVGVPLFAIISGYGASKLIDFLWSKQKKVLVIVTMLLLAASLTILGKRYFLDYPKYTTKEWEYGLKEAIHYAENNSYSCVTISNQIYLRKCGSLHVFVPFYTQSPPQEHQRSPIAPQHLRKLFHGEADYSMGKYSFVSLAEKNKLNEKCLWIINPNEAETIARKGYNWKEVHIVKNPLGKEVLKLIEISNSTT
jgi:4-amino-4-deoxy-L-arabinose transferase-like glycosyltransferase